MNRIYLIDENPARAAATRLKFEEILGDQYPILDETQLPTARDLDGKTTGVVVYGEPARGERNIGQLRNFLGIEAFLPAILLTESNPREVEARACEQGFWEVLRWDELSRELFPRVMRYTLQAHQQQQQLFKKQQQLDAIMLTTRCCLWRVGLPDARLMEFSGPASEMLGLALEQQIGEPIFSLPGFQREAVHLKRMLVQLGEGTEVEAHLNYTKPDGSPKLLQIRLQQVSPIAALGFLIDVTHQREARQVRHLLGEAMNQAGEAVFLTKGIPGTPNPEVVFMNRAAETLFGYSHEELRVLNPDLFAGLHRDQKILTAIIGQLSSGSSSIGEYVQFHRNGRPFLCQTNILPIRDETGRVSHYLVQLRDMTRERKTRQDLEDSEHRLRQIVERAPFPIMILAEDGAIIHMSDSWFEQSGYPKETITHVDDWIAKAGGSRKDRIRQGIQATFVSRRRLIREEGVVQHADGSERMWYFHSAPIQPLPDGRALIVTMASDVTDLKRALAVAEKANRTKDEFLAVISHELRTPLNPILALSDLLKRQEADSDNREMLEMINSAGQDLLGLIENILDYTRIEFGVFNSKPDMVRLDEFIGQIVEVHTPQFTAKNLRLNETHDECGKFWDSPLIFDSEWVSRLIHQLLSNALKFTSAGEVSIQVAVFPREEKGMCNLRFTVSDTGIGIPEDEIPNILAPFYQVDGSLTRAHGGTGLGLAVCSRILRCLDGSLSIKSEPHRGSQFTVSVPVGVPA